MTDYDHDACKRLDELIDLMKQALTKLAMLDARLAKITDKLEDIEEKVGFDG